MRTTRVFGALALALVVLAVPGAARAADPTDAATDPGPRRVSIAGIEVQVDPQTGRLVQPDPEQARELATYLIRTLDRSPQGLELVRHADGKLSVAFHDRLQSVVVATVGEDRRVTPQCLTDTRAAEALLEAATHGVDPAISRAPARRAVEK